MKLDEAQRLIRKSGKNLRIFVRGCVKCTFFYLKKKKANQIISKMCVHVLLKVIQKQSI